MIDDVPVSCRKQSPSCLAYGSSVIRELGESRLERNGPYRRHKSCTLWSVGSG